MSQVYSTEPATSGRVTLETTAGPIDVQLWCKECPLATRLFLQLCVDGYYDNMIFHRIMDNFLIQTGALRKGDPIPTDASNNYNNNDDEMKEYWKKVVGPFPFGQENEDETSRKQKLELNGRIRFNHRGQIAMAAPVNSDDDGEELVGQFFITLEEAPFLDQKHVIFGTVVGPTMFNAIRIGRTEVDEHNHRPVDLELSPPTILSTKIHTHTFHDIIAHTSNLPWKHSSSSTKQNKQVDSIKARKKKRKGKKDFNVLSFGHDMMEDEEDTGAGIQSSHDLLSNDILKKETDATVQLLSTQPNNNSHEKPISDDPIQDTPIQYPPNIVPSPVMEKHPQPVLPSEHVDSKPIILYQKKKQTKDTEVEEEQNNTVSPPPTAPVEKETVKKSALEERRANYIRKSQNRAMQKKKKQDDIMAKLQSFRNKIKKQDSTNSSNNQQKDDAIASRMAHRIDRAKQMQEQKNKQEAAMVSYHGQILEEDPTNNKSSSASSSNWYQTNFKCKRHIDHSSRDGGDGRNVDDYVVVDPKKSKKHHHSSRGHHHHHHSREKKTSHG